MAERQEFMIAFRGEVTSDEEDGLRRAGYGFHRDGIGTSSAWFGSPDDPSAVTIESKHVVTHVVAETRDEALRRVSDVLGRGLEDATVAP
jgi:hypothetical protein